MRTKADVIQACVKYGKVLEVDVDTYIKPISLDYDELQNPLAGSIAAQVAQTNALVFKSQC